MPFKLMFLTPGDDQLKRSCGRRLEMFACDARGDDLICFMLRAILRIEIILADWPSELKWRGRI